MWTLGELRKTLSIHHDQKCDAKKELSTLKDVDDVTEPVAIDSESKVTVILDGIFVGVKTKELPPKQYTGTAFISKC